MKSGGRSERVLCRVSGLLLSKRTDGLITLWGSERLGLFLKVRALICDGRTPDDEYSKPHDCSIGDIF